MNLNTHLFFAAATAAVFVGKPEAIVLAALGSIIPDLDRPYWFIPKKRVAEEEYHRAFLHNIIILTLAYLFNQYLAVGLFSHLMLDTMTTVKDRGVEWLFPFTRIVSRDYWSQAEVQEEPLVWMPWRRTYGPALNGHMLDTYVFLCSIGALLSWFVFQSLHHYLDLTHWYDSGFAMIAGTVLMLFASGEYLHRWLEWPRTKRILAIALLALTVSGVPLLASFLPSQGAVFSWRYVPSDWLLRTNNFLNTLFLVSVLVCALIILRFTRTTCMVLARYFPALCTKMPSRDFIIDEKTGTSDIFV